MVMDVSWRLIWVSVLWEIIIHLFWVGQGWDEWGGQVTPQTYYCVMEVWLIHCYYPSGSGNICCVAVVVNDNGYFSIGMIKYVVCLCKGCDGRYVVSLNCEAWSWRSSCVGSMSDSSCSRCCMFVSCVQSVAVLMRSSWLIIHTSSAAGIHLEWHYVYDT